MNSEAFACHYGVTNNKGANLALAALTPAHLVYLGQKMYATGDSGNKGIGTPGLDPGQRAARAKAYSPRPSGN